MALELHILITALLPPTRGISLAEVSVEDASVGLRLMATVPTAACPDCAVPSSSVHSRYQRRLTDLLNASTNDFQRVGDRKTIPPVIVSPRDI
jgi:hypothetical protein